MEQRDPVKLADRLLENADALGKSTLKVFASTAIAAAVLWFTSIEPLVPKLNTLQSASLITKITKKHLADYRKKDNKNNDTLVRLEEHAKEAITAQKGEAANAAIAFSIPGLPSLNVPTRYAPTLWCILALSLLSYLHLSRLAILTQLARSARLLHDLEPHNFPYRPPSPYLPPWWIMPLPTANGDTVSAKDFRTYLQTPSTAPGALVGVVALFLVGFALQVRVATIGIAGIAAFGDGTQTVEDLALSTVTILAVAATPILLILWLYSMKVPDFLPPLEPRIYSRRQILLSGISLLAVSTIAIGTAIKTGPNLLVRLIRTPRFRRRPRGSYQALGLPQALYKNRRSDKIHYVMVASHAYKHSALKPGDTFLTGVRVSAIRRPNPKNFAPIVGAPPSDPNLSVLASVSPIRRAALMARLSDELEGSGNKVAALQALLQAVSSDLQDLDSGRRRRPNIRIYYLLARRALLSGNSVILGKMLDAIGKSSHHAFFSDAIRSWTDSSSRWRKRLAFVKGIPPRVDLPM